MDSFEFNKIAGAVLAALLFLVAVGIIAESLFHHEAPHQKAYVVEGVAEEGAPAPAVKEEQPLAVLLAQADPEAGKKKAGLCASCHTFEQGGPNRQGPNLYGVVGGPRTHRADFKYSDAMKSAGGSWTYEALFDYLRKPSEAVPGNAMIFAGLKDPQDRANVIAYLRQQSDNPPPLPPVPETVAAPVEGTPAAGESPPAQATPSSEGAAQDPAPQAPASAH
jgi:cytochrome c